MGTLDKDPGKRQMGIPFEGFIAYLRRQGFIIGVDHYLRLHELLNRLKPGCQPADLKYLLCPLFATNKKQQHQFYRAFESYFKYLEVEADIIKAKKPVTKAPSKTKDIESSEEYVITRKWPYILASAVLLLIVVLISYWVYQPKTIVESPKSKIEDSSETPSGHSEETSAVEETSKPSIEPQPSKSTLKTDEGKKDSTVGKEIDTSQPVKSKDHEILPEKPNALKDSSAPSFDVVRKWAEKIDQLNNENKHKYEPTFYQRYWYIFRWVGFLGTFIISLFIEIYKYSQRKLILQKKRSKKRLYGWPIIVENPEPGIVKNDQFHEAARFLRMRLKSDIRQIDVPKTISKTTEKAGFPSIEYTTLTRPPEYLILIDLPAYRDHHAQLFDSIAKALEKEGLFVSRYFYEKDPRVCFKEPNEQRFYLNDLKTRYSNHRLIIFGNGEEFLDPISGVLDNWTNLFQDWRERAILTPEPPKYWSIREVALAHEFIVLPASLGGLAALVDHFKLSLESDLKTWKKADSQNIGTPAPDCNIDELKEYLGEDAFQWLCACAVYPELHWDLTLHLGSLSCMPENLICEENLLRLIRLPWFRTGSMPDELRWLLISELDTRKSRVIRTSIIELLEKNPPPKESFAFDTYRLQLVVQRLMISRKNRKQRKEMIDKLKTVSDKEIVQDYILLRFLDSTSKSPLSFILPKRLRKVFYKKGVPIFGFKTGIRFLLTVLIATVLFIFLKEPHIPNIEIISKFPELVPLKGGIFQMGSAPTDKNSSPSERPQHKVNIAPFAIGKFEVTNAEFVQFLNDKGNQKEGGGLWLLIDPFLTKINFSFSGKFFVEEGYENYPVVGVSWYGAKAYCRWLKERTGIPFRLPTEAEWEYACRGGTETEYSFEEDTKNYVKYGWFRSNSGFEPNEVGQKLSNKFGLYDMHGNMWEWCLDGWSKNYQNTPRNGQAVKPEGYKIRVVRGGSWYEPVKEARSANRHNFLPILEINLIVGFRVVVSLLDGYTGKIEKPVDIIDIITLESKGIKVVKNNNGFWEANYGDGLKMVYIPHGEFIMGSNEYGDERPIHTVYLDSYWMGKTEVTVKQYMKFVNATKSHYPEWLEEGNKYNINSGSDNYYRKVVSNEYYPIVGISWYDAESYCGWLSKKTGLTFKLPTEAQWEKAARGIDNRKYPWGSREPNETLSNFGLKINKTARVGSYPKGASPYGLLDMAGNVWEWCYDWYDEYYYNSSPYKNPAGPDTYNCTYRVLRGGSWKFYDRVLRCANRYYDRPSVRYYFLGFRLCMENELVDPYERNYRDEDKFNSPENDPIVYITKTGKNYHREGCPYTKYTKIKIRLSEAKRKGYTPCSKCKPPK